MANAGSLDVLNKVSGRGVGSLLFSDIPDALPQRYYGLRLGDLETAVKAIAAVELGRVPRNECREALWSATGLGGAQPKFAISDSDAAQWIAKFRAQHDPVDRPRVEFATMQLASSCKLNVAETQLREVGGVAVLLVRRFDRGDRIRHYASAHAFWNYPTDPTNGVPDKGSYPGLVSLSEELPNKGLRVSPYELFRRMIFNVVVGNTDDHGRNHGFLMERDKGWSLSPAFDLSPSLPCPGGIHAMDIGPQRAYRSIENAIGACENFGLEEEEARLIVGEITACVRDEYPGRLDDAGLPAAERDLALKNCLLKGCVP